MYKKLVGCISNLPRKQRYASAVFKSFQFPICWPHSHPNLRRAPGQNLARASPVKSLSLSFLSALRGPNRRQKRNLCCAASTPESRPRVHRSRGEERRGVATRNRTEQNRRGDHSPSLPCKPNVGEFLLLPSFLSCFQSLSGFARVRTKAPDRASPPPSFKFKYSPPPPPSSPRLK